ncbi:MAG: TMEM165/GDT1 family protein [Selenomonadales bacterium]|nr:TMEM165/GDT1 family protein [Selenomonadales bacterium]
MTVMIAFFLAEMGDKTQFATIVLAAQLGEVIPVWMGTTTGMMIADGIGIFVGAVLGSRIPERQVKWGAAIIFMLFGLYGIWDALPLAYKTVYTAGAMALICTGASYLVNKMG